MPRPPKPGGTSRTGTTHWINLRRQTIRRARRDGQTTCPECNQGIIWEAHPHHPKAPQVDHITPHSQGGQDTPENLRVICRHCNQRLGGKLGARRNRATKVQPTTFHHAEHW